MIVIKVEIWPFGDEKKGREIGRLHIVNDGTQTGTDIGDYDVFAGHPETHRDDAFEQARVEGHQRAKGIWPLLKRAVNALFPESAVDHPKSENVETRQ